MAGLFDEIVAAVLDEAVPCGAWVLKREIMGPTRVHAVVEARVLVSRLCRMTSEFHSRASTARALGRNESTIKHYDNLFQWKPSYWESHLARALARLQASIAAMTSTPLEMKMKITMESTPRIEMINGMQCRMWEGVTAGGVKCFAFIPVISVHRSEDNSQFERELKEHPPKGHFNSGPPSFEIRQVL